MRGTVNPTKGQSSTPKMRTTQLYQFISIYLIIFKSLTCTNSLTIDQKHSKQFHAFSQHFKYQTIDLQTPSKELQTKWSIMH